MFCDVFQQGALNVLQIPRFSSCFYFQFSKQTNQKQWYLHCFDKTTCKKNDVLKQFFAFFQLVLVNEKNQSVFAAFLPPFIRTQEGIKSPKIFQLHLNLTLCLSQSLLQKFYPLKLGEPVWAQKCPKLRCFMNVPCILPAKKRVPPSPPS